MASGQSAYTPSSLTSQHYDPDKVPWYLSFFTVKIKFLKVCVCVSVCGTEVGEEERDLGLLKTIRGAYMRGTYKRRENNGRVDEERVERCRGNRKSKGSEPYLWHTIGASLTQPHGREECAEDGPAQHFTHSTGLARAAKRWEPQRRKHCSASCLNFPRRYKQLEYLKL